MKEFRIHKDARDYEGFKVQVFLNEEETKITMVSLCRNGLCANMTEKVFLALYEEDAQRIVNEVMNGVR